MTIKTPPMPVGAAGSELLWPEHVADLLGVPVGTLAQWRHRSKGPRFTTVGRHPRYRLSDLQHWLDDGGDGRLTRRRVNTEAGAR